MPPEPTGEELQKQIESQSVVWSQKNRKLNEIPFGAIIQTFANPLAWVYNAFQGIRKDSKIDPNGGDEDKNKYKYKSAFGKSTKPLDIKEEKPFFKKSYSAIDQLVPFIKVSVKKTLIKDKLTLENQSISFFDIPYNYIKSLKLESKTDSPTTDVLTLVLEDPQGSISTIMFAYLNLLGATNSSDPSTPEIVIQYGWGGGNPFKIKTKGTMPIYYLQSENKEYTIQKADISYENMKQRITITAYPKLTSMPFSYSLKNKPHTVLNTATPTDDLFRNRFLFISADKYQKEWKTGRNADAGLPTFSIGNEKETYHTSVAESIEKFYEKCNFLYQSTRTSGSKLFINKNEMTKRNSKYTKDEITESIDPKDSKKKIKTQTKSFDTLRLDSYSSNSLHPYLVFCYYFYNYLEQLHTQDKNTEVFILPFFEEDRIFAWNGHASPDLQTTSGSHFKEEAGKDWEIVYQEKLFGLGKKINLTSATSSAKLKLQIPETHWINRNNIIKDSQTWEEVLLDIGSKIKIEPKSPTTQANPPNTNNTNKKEPLPYHTLHFSTIHIPEAKDNEVNSNKKVIANRKAEITEYLKKVGSDTEFKIGASALANKITSAMNDSKKNVLLIFLTESAWAFKSTVGEKTPMQSYTVFPKANITRKISDTIFNAGSSNLLDESFPDVISFNPKIDFKNLVNFMVSAETSLKGDYYSNNRLLDQRDENFKIIIGSTDNFNTKIEAVNKAMTAIANVLNKPPDTADNTNSIKVEILDTTGNFKIENNDVQMWSKSLAGKASDYVHYTSDWKLNGTTGEERRNILLAILQDFKRFVNYEKGLTLGSSISSAFNSTDSAFPGEPNSVEYNKMMQKQKKFYTTLRNQGVYFDAELKILGEPAYSYHWGTAPPIKINVNSPDGTPNYLCTGVYGISGITQEIEGGKFTTTLQLKFDGNRNKTIE